MTTWVISDTHFGHAQLLSGSDPARPFDTLGQMHDEIVQRWNAVVRPGDTVYHLGDVYFNQGWRVLERLNGTKHLILGNHDAPSDPHLTTAFREIALWKVFAEERVVLTHLPLDLSARGGLGQRFACNIHGHLHHRPAPSDRHLCVCVEQTGYAPLNLDALLADMSTAGTKTAAAEGTDKVLSGLAGQ